MPAVKRQVVAKSNASITKRPKLDEFSTRCASIVKALQGAEGLPVPVLAMLEKMLPDSLAVAKEERHPFQTTVVAMLEDEVLGVEASMNKEIQEAEAVISGGEERKPDLQAIVTEAEATLEQVTNRQSEKKYALSEAAATFKATKATLAEAKKAQQLADKDVASAMERRVALERATKLLMEDSKDDQSEQVMTCEAKTAELLALTVGLECDESLMAALPNALSSEAGAFGEMVLKQFREEISKGLATIEVTVKDAEPVRSEKQAAVMAAEAEHTAANKELLAAAASYQDADEKRQAAETALEAAQKPLHDLAQERSRAARAISKVKSKLTKFQDGPLATFAELREYTAVQPGSDDVEGGMAPEVGQERQSAGHADSEAQAISCTPSHIAPEASATDCAEQHREASAS